MIRRISLVLALAALTACGQAPEPGEDVTASLGRYQHMPGFYDLYWDEGGGRLILAIDAFSDQPPPKHQPSEATRGAPAVAVTNA